MSERFGSLGKIPHRSNPHRFAEPPGRGHKGLAALRRTGAVGGGGFALQLPAGGHIGPPLRRKLTLVR